MQRTCRYNHGNLEKISGVWAFSGITKEKVENPSFPHGFINRNDLNGTIYTASIYQCQKCGYIELFDDEAHDEP